MTTRINHFQAAPALAKALSEASIASHKSSLDPTIRNLIEIRVSQLNGCAFTICRFGGNRRCLAQKKKRRWLWRRP